MSAICDVYEPNLERALSAATKISGKAPKPYRHYKDLLADQDVRAVLIATPEHWHYQMLMDALEAGKDVYVEKPLCQTPEQGIKLMDAEARSKSVIQVGMQRRSYDLYKEGREIVARKARRGANGALLVVEQLSGRRRREQIRPAARLGTVAGPGSAPPLRSEPFPAMASLFGLRRRHSRRPGCARL